MVDSVDTTTFDKIIAKLGSLKLEYKLTEHEPVLTCQQAADVRGVALGSGAKAMLLKDCKKGIFHLAVLSAACRFNSKAFKQLSKIRDLKFASEQEVFDITKCLPGAVPPMGSMFGEGVPVWVDSSLEKFEQINFNCGLRTHSLQMAFADYKKFEGFEQTYSISE